MKECNGAVLNLLKRISGLGPPISPSGHQEAPISSTLGSLICPLRHQKAPKLMFHCVIRGQFLVFLIRSFSSPQFPHCFIECFQFPHCVIKEQLRGYCTPDQFFDYLCIFLKNYNTLVTSKIYVS